MAKLKNNIAGVSSSLKSKKSPSYNSDEAIEYLNDHAESESKGRCARYVRLALLAGGLNIVGNPVDAKDYGPFLLNRGFAVVDEVDYKPQKGDIAVFDAFQGAKKYHPSGHIQMYNGIQWVSDFIQQSSEKVGSRGKGFWAGGDYRNAQPKYKIYR